MSIARDVEWLLALTKGMEVGVCRQGIVPFISGTQKELSMQGHPRSSHPPAI